MKCNLVKYIGNNESILVKENATIEDFYKEKEAMHNEYKDIMIHDFDYGRGGHVDAIITEVGYEIHTKDSFAIIELVYPDNIIKFKEIMNQSK